LGLHHPLVLWRVCGPDPRGLKITHGHSKDRRPDLKQIVLTLLANREGMPLWGTVENGNASDKKLSGEVLDQIRQVFRPEQLRSLTYVADSAFATEENLAKAQAMGLGVLTRLPDTFGAAHKAKLRAWQEDRWEEMGAVAARQKATTYQASEQRGEIGGRAYRLVVYRSDHLERRKERALVRDLAAEREALEEEAQNLTRHSYVCREDAEAQGRAWLLRHEKGMHALSYEVREERVRDPRPRPGRPKKGEEPTYHLEYRLELKVEGPKESAVRAERQRRSAFVLLTTVPREKASAYELLVEYKSQVSLERRFAFMKDPEIV
jgi:transposase